MALPDGAPNKNATQTEWAEYAITHGVASYEAWEATRDALVDRFTQPDPEPAPPPNPQDIGPGHGDLWTNDTGTITGKTTITTDANHHEILAPKPTRAPRKPKES